MDDKQKLALLEEMMELDEGELDPSAALDDLDCWDSMTKLSLIVLADEQFKKTLSGDTIRTFKTVRDILDYLG